MMVLMTMVFYANRRRIGLAVWRANPPRHNCSVRFETHVTWLRCMMTNTSRFKASCNNIRDCTRAQRICLHTMFKDCSSWLLAIKACGFKRFIFQIFSCRVNSCNACVGHSTWTRCNGYSARSLQYCVICMATAELHSSCIVYEHKFCPALVLLNLTLQEILNKIWKTCFRKAKTQQSCSSLPPPPPAEGVRSKYIGVVHCTGLWWPTLLMRGAANTTKNRGKMLVKEFWQNKSPWFHE